MPRNDKGKPVRQCEASYVNPENGAIVSCVKRRKHSEDDATPGDPQNPQNHRDARNAWRTE